MEPIVRFKCGRCKREGKNVVPVEAKGLAEMVIAEDGLCHFRWATRPNQDVELDLILVRGLFFFPSFFLFFFFFFSLFFQTLCVPATRA